MSKKNRIDATGDNTVIGLGTVIDGNITSDAVAIRIDGVVNGSVSTKGNLIVGIEGIVNGAVTAANLNLGGKINGDTMVDNRVEIDAKGVLIGDLTTKILSMDDNAVLQGRVSMKVETPTEDAEK